MMTPEERNSALADYVNDKFKIAEAWRQRSRLDERLNDCQRAWRGEDLEYLEAPDVGSAEEDGAPPRLVLNITRPLVRGVVALMQRPLAQIRNRPFVITPSPEVELSDEARVKIANQIAADTPQIVEAAGADPNKVSTIIDKLSETVRAEEQSFALRAAERMSNRVADILLDGRFESAFNEFLYYLALYPYAVLKMEDSVVRTLQWAGQTLVPTDKTVKYFTAVSPFDFYPAPNPRSVAECEFVIEKRRVTATDLANLPGVDGYDSAAVLRVLEEYPEGFKIGLQSTVGTTPEDNEGALYAYDALGFYGSVPGTMLEAWGVTVPNKTLHYEAEVWVIAGIAIKAVLNPDPLGRRPFFVSSFEAIPNELIGESPGTDVLAVQKLVTATASALVRNMAFSSGPVGEVDSSRVMDDEDPRLVFPSMMREVKPSRTGDAGPAYRFYTVPSLSGELMSLLEKFQEYAFTVLGIPRIAFGGPQGLGTVGRTAGGVAALLNQSSNTMYHALENVETSVLQPLISCIVDWELLYGTDDQAKGDLRVRTIGLSGIVQKESQQEKLQWALQSLGPLVGTVDPQSGNPIIPADAPARILYRLFKDSGVPTDGIFEDYDRQSALQGEIGGKLEPVVAAPPLDGRSAVAEQAIANQNNIG